MSTKTKSKNFIKRAKKNNHGRTQQEKCHLNYNQLKL